MKFSEAVRLGSMTIPAAHGPTFTLDEKNAVCGACAMGTAMLAAGFRQFHSFASKEVVALWPYLESEVEFPNVPGCMVGLREAIVTLFEDDKWSREQIADWVETIEQAQALPTVPDPEAVTVQLITT